MKKLVLALAVAAALAVPIAAYGVAAQTFQTRSHWTGGLSGGNMTFYDNVITPTYPVASMWTNCPTLAILHDPQVGVIYWDEYEEWITAQWVTTATGAGTVAHVDNGSGGMLLLTNAGADDDSEEIQRYIAGVNGLNWVLTAGKPLWFEIKLAINDATQSDFWVGLSEVDTTLVDGPVDGRVGFKKDDGDANIDCETAEVTVQTVTDSGVDIVTDTFIRLGFYYDGATAGSVYFFVNGAVAATHTENLPVEELVISLAIQNGEAVSRTMSVDYIKIVRLR